MIVESTIVPSDSHTVAALDDTDQNVAKMVKRAVAKIRISISSSSLDAPKDTQENNSTAGFYNLPRDLVGSLSPIRRIWYCPVTLSILALQELQRRATRSSASTDRDKSAAARPVI